MRLIAKSKENTINIRVDSIEVKEGEIVFAYRTPKDGIAPTEFVGMFDLGSMDYLYISEAREKYEQMQMAVR